MALIKMRSNSIMSHPLRTTATILVVVFAFLAIAKWTPVSTILISTQSQLYKVSSSVNTFFIHTFSSTESLKSQLEKYKTLSSKYLIDAVYITKLENELKDLEKLLGYTQSTEYQTITAKILSRSQSQSHSLLIDQGSENGVKIGLAVVVDEGHLIGTVSSVSSYTATIRLLEDNQTRIPVSVLGGNETSGLLIGDGGFLLQMDYIPQIKELSIDEIIITSNLHESIPNGLIIGTIYEIVKEETSSFQQAFIEPIHKSSSYSSVLIIDTTNVKIYEE